MPDIDDFIASIYEAGALPELWTSTLESIARLVSAGGANLIRTSASGLTITSTPGIAEVTRDFAEEGWNEQNTRVGRLLERANHPGFLTDVDLHSQEELRILPMYREFLTPRRADAGAATFIPGSSGDGIIIAFEAFTDHDAAQSARPLLDRLRPHIARAAVLSSRIETSRIASIIEALDVISIPLALLDRRGALIAGTESFVDAAREFATETRTRLRLLDEAADNRLVQAMTKISVSGSGTSIALRNPDGSGIAVLQIVPALSNARDLFGNVAAYALLSRPANMALPSLDIITTLFDLTPAEARVARSIAYGKSVKVLASELGVSVETIRSHLKKAFLKTSTGRQSELAALLTRFS